MVKPPVVLQRRAAAMHGGHHDPVWWSLGQSAGQQLFYPPDVGGWDYTRWLDTATFRARWFIGARSSRAPSHGRRTRPSDPGELVERAIAVLGQSDGHDRRRRTSCTAFARAQLADEGEGPRPADGRDRTAPLLATSPDLQTALMSCR